MLRTVSYDRNAHDGVASITNSASTYRDDNCKSAGGFLDQPCSDVFFGKRAEPLALVSYIVDHSTTHVGKFHDLLWPRPRVRQCFSISITFKRQSEHANNATARTGWRSLRRRLGDEAIGAEWRATPRRSASRCASPPNRFAAAITNAQRQRRRDQ